MKSYPHILGPSKAPNLPCIAFYKYDGSNLRWEWTRKRGWFKFGTRTRLFNEFDEDFGQAVPLFFNGLSDQIDKKIKSKYRNAEKVTVFTEFFGPSSFAGNHLSDETKELRLFDICIHKKGLISPREFINNFGHLDFSAKVIYEGNLNKQFIKDVQNGKYPVYEGVVCKGGEGHKLWMRKIKTLEYMTRLEGSFGLEWDNYWE